MSQGFSSTIRMQLLAGGVLLCFAAVGARLVQLHVLDRDNLVRFVDKARRQITVEPARRGAITDARGNLLATSRSYVVLGADPELLRREDEAKWPELARLAGLRPADLDNLLRRGTAAQKLAAASPDTETRERRIRWVKLSDGVDESAYGAILALKIRGVYGTREYRRVYPNGQLASHLVGYVNKEGAPVTGVERHFDLYLQGQDGWIETEKDGARRELSQFRSREVAAVDGQDVVLTVDSVIQNIIEAELKSIAAKFDPHFATIIVSEPHTGAILGLANYPTYDPNEFNKAPLEAQRNYAVTDIVEPGSTFKIVAAGAALNEGVVTPSSRFDCALTSVFHQGKPRAMPKEDHAFGWLSVSEIVSHSSNRGAAQLAMRLGDQQFFDYARQFGFGQLTGFPLGGEVRGILDEPKRWDGLTITRMPMGHAVAATPLQIHMAMSAVANNGVLLRPQIVKEVRSAGGEVLRRFEPEVRRQVLKPATAAVLAQMLRKVVSPEGTAAETQIEGFELAGKTGTTQKLVDGRYVTTRHVGSFSGFFPAHRPEVVLTVIVDDAKVASGSAYGRVVAAPSFRRVSEQLIQYLNIKPGPVAARQLLALKGGDR
jgi:cell division protein FtsI/penicillin-binding protein 2